MVYFQTKKYIKHKILDMIILTFLLQIFLLQWHIITLYDVCAVPWRVQYRGGYHDACGGYLEYRGGMFSTVRDRGMFSTVGDILSTVGDIMSNVGGYLENRGEYSVRWGIS